MTRLPKFNVGERVTVEGFEQYTVHVVSALPESLSIAEPTYALSFEIHPGTKRHVAFVALESNIRKLETQ